MPSGPPPNQIRTSIYLPRKLHRRLRATLAARGETVSGWIVRMARELVDGKKS